MKESLSIEEITSILEKRLGFSGRMIYWSKSGYNKKYPNNLSVFNANIVINTKNGLKKIWYGDIDITLDEGILMDLAKTINERVYVLPEMACRFDTENNPNVSAFVYSTDGTDSQIGSYYPKEEVSRDSDNKLKYNR